MTLNDRIILRPASASLPKTKTGRAVLLAAAMLAVATLLSGCGTIVEGTISTANQIDQARDKARRSDLASQHLDYIKALQAKGDPLGDYLWAEANEKQLVPNAIQNPATIRRLYQSAAEKGSVDARLVLAVKQFKEAGVYLERRDTLEARKNVATREGRTLDPRITASLRRFDENAPPDTRTPFIEDLGELPAKEQMWKNALIQLEQISQQRCFFNHTYIFAPQHKRCLAPRIAADEIWSAFRDGMAYPKDKALRDLWYDRAIACEQTPAYREAAQRCQVFGDDNYRFKGKD